MVAAPPCLHDKSTRQPEFGQRRALVTNRAERPVARCLPRQRGRWGIGGKPPMQMLRTPRRHTLHATEAGLATDASTSNRPMAQATPSARGTSSPSMGPGRHKSKCAKAINFINHTRLHCDRRDKSASRMRADSPSKAGGTRASKERGTGSPSYIKKPWTRKPPSIRPHWTDGALGRTPPPPIFSTLALFSTTARARGKLSCRPLPFRLQARTPQDDCSTTPCSWDLTAPH